MLQWPEYLLLYLVWMPLYGSLSFMRQVFFVSLWSSIAIQDSVFIPGMFLFSKPDSFGVHNKFCRASSPVFFSSPHPPKVEYQLWVFSALRSVFQPHCALVSWHPERISGRVLCVVHLQEPLWPQPPAAVSDRVIGGWSAPSTSKVELDRSLRRSRHVSGWRMEWRRARRTYD